MKVALFVTCLVDGVVPSVGQAAVSLLRRLGCEVEVPLAQTCCGQMHVNTGYPDQALPLVRRHVDAFAGYEAVVAPSGSCVGSVRHQHADVARRAGDRPWLMRRRSWPGGRSSSRSSWSIGSASPTSARTTRTG